MLIHHAMKTCGGVDGFLNSALGGGQWSASRPSLLIYAKRAPPTFWALDGSQSRSDIGEEGGKPAPGGKSTQFPVVKPVAYHIDRPIPAPAHI
jgi:hypothetical protein